MLVSSQKIRLTKAIKFIKMASDMITTEELLEKLRGTNLDSYNEESTDKVFAGRRQFYFNSYLYILSHLKAQKGNLNPESTMVAICLIYSWMPRVPHKVVIKDNDVIKLLNKAYHSTYENKLSEQEIETIQFSINNSMVGTSKILHFINPNVYPMWDSNIAKIVKSEKDKSEKEVLNYLNYQNACLKLSDDDCNECIKNFNSEKFNGLSKLRKIDMALFSLK